MSQVRASGKKNTREIPDIYGKFAFLNAFSLNEIH